MRIEVKMFAAARQRAGAAVVVAMLDAGATVADLRRWLATEFPDLAPLLGSSLFAIDSQYAADNAPLAEGQEVACIPPVSGG